MIIFLQITQIYTIYVIDFETIRLLDVEQYDCVYLYLYNLYTHQ